MHRYIQINIIVVLVALCAALLSGCAGHGAAQSAGHASATNETAAAHGQTAEAAATPSPSHATAPSPTPVPTPSPTPTEAPVGTLQDGWVVGIPAYVPRFEAGTIDYSQSKIVEGSVSSVFSLCICDVGTADMDAYAARLRQQGFTVALSNIDSTYTLTASLDGDWDTATLVITLADGQTVAYYVLGVPV